MRQAGSRYPRFQRALERGSLNSILAAAADLDRVGLNDALAICAAVAREEPAEFDRYAIRWIAAAINEWESLDCATLISAIGVLERVRRDRDPVAAAQALRSLR
jgi:hypothetical protein